MTMDSKYRFAFFKKNKFEICNHDFIMSNKNTIGQYLSSNWFKQNVEKNENIYLFIIRYYNKNDIEHLRMQSLTQEEHVLGYSQGSQYIIGTFLMSYQNIESDSLTHYIMEDIRGNNPIQLCVSLVKDNNDNIFIYGPRFTL